MKRLRDGLYVIAPETFAERRGDQWYITDEDSVVVAGPFASLEELDTWHGRDDVDPDATTLEEDLASADAEVGIVTLRQAAKYLPVTHQALYARRRTGGLPAPAFTQDQPSGPPREFYKLSELIALFEGKTLVERVAEGSRRSWARLTDAERAERVAKIRKGRR